MGTARKVAYNTLTQVAGRLLGLIITLVTVNFIANHLTVDGSALRAFGQYTIIFTYVSIIGSAADFGLFTLLVREMSGKSRDEAGELVGNALAFRLLLFGATLVTFLLLYQFLPYLDVVKQGIIIGVVIAFSMLFSQVIATVFQSKLLADRIVIAETLGKVAIAVATILALRAGYGLLAVVFVNLLGQLLTLAVSYYLVRGLVHVKLRLDTKLWRSLLPQFGTIALINLLALVHFKTDMLLLTFLKGEADVGIYGVAYKLFEVVLVIPSIFAANLLPVLSTALLENRGPDANRMLRRSASTLLIIAAVLMVTLTVFAPLAIVFITQPSFLAAVAPLQVLVVSVIFVFITTLVSQAIIASRNQGALVRGYLIVVAVNILLNLYAIPRYSYMGAATVTVITEAILLIYTLAMSRRHFSDYINWPLVARVTIAAAATWLIVRLLPLGNVDALEFAASSKFSQVGWLLGAFLTVSGVFLAALLVTFRGSLRRVLELLWVR
ncbi:MAG: flippase [Patescibacteria group bacterium]